MNELEPLIVDKLVVVNDALRRSGLPYAFGGAVALGYCVIDPRGTSDLDLNVFVPSSSARSVLAALPPEVAWADDDERLLERDAQARLHWGDTPVGLFLSNHPFHDEIASRIRQVPFGVDAIQIPVLPCDALAVFKAFFARGKDFVDIAHMVEAGALDVALVRKAIASLLGDDASQLARFDEAVLDGLDPHRREAKRRFPGA